ncbi:MAG: hypothetical protein NTW25_00575 [Candidatus Kapabacteria bacterium]|nr:hypothetical protein [Candidatus Kapabacteria bacterium]
MSIQQKAKQIEILETQVDRIKNISAVPSDLTSELMSVDLFDFAYQLNQSAINNLIPQYELEIERIKQTIGDFKDE